MLRLALILHTFIGSVFGGVFLVVALLAEFDALWMLLGAVLLGFVIAFPVAILVAKRLMGTP